jgi:hypothetical protein
LPYARPLVIEDELELLESDSVPGEANDLLPDRSQNGQEGLFFSRLNNPVDIAVVDSASFDLSGIEVI